MEAVIINDIVSLLKKEKINNLSVFGFIENNIVIDVWQEGSSVAVLGKSDRAWLYFSSENEKEFRILVKKLKGKTSFFGSLYSWMIPIINDGAEAEWILTSDCYYLPEDVNLNHIKIATRRLTQTDIPHILNHSHYKQFLSIEYLNDRIKRSYSAGIDMNGELAAWGLTHDDGALGSLHVTDDYRGHGFAQEIIKSLVCQCRDNDEIPFAQVEPNNIPSIRLLEKLGFVKDREIIWMKVK
jgi:GNAT superfamily N-acetyltransferase